MRIAFFNYLRLEQGGGTARFFIDASTGLKKRFPNLEISIITLSENKESAINLIYSLYFLKNIKKDLINSNVEIKETLAKFNISYLNIDGYLELKSILSGYDIIYAKNDFVEAFILKYLVGYQYLNQVIFGFHTPIYYELTPNFQSNIHNLIYGSFIYIHLIKQAEKFHVLNRFDQNYLKKIFKNKVITKIYNPFDFKKYEKIKINKVKAIKNKNKLNLLWVGRLTYEKGADDLINLISEINLTELAEKVQWNIVGGGELENKVKQLVQKFANVSYFGFVENQILTKCFRENNLFLSTSRWESFPYTFLEAQTFGLPIISYDIHGCNEIVKEGDNGYLVKTFEEYKRKLIYLIQNPKKIIKKKRVKKYIRSLVNTEEIYEKLYKLLID